MPSALDAAAERLAPARAGSNYFDPAASQSVLSRYANAGRELADSELAAQAAGRLFDTRNALERGRRDRVQFDRDEEDYREKQDFKLQRGGFLDTISKIDPEAEDFEKQISDLYRTLPQAALQDDAVVDMLAFKRKRADDLLNERQMQTRRQETLDDRKEFLRYKAQNDPRLNVLTPEERTRFITDDGDFDFVGAGQLAYEKTRQNKKDDQIEVAQEKQRIKLEAEADERLTPDLRAMKTLAREHVLGDAVAFPNQVEALRKGLTKTKGDKAVPPKDEDLKKAPGYEDARRYESRKFEAEMESARNMTVDEYVARGGSGLSDTAKQKRRDVWNAAHAGQGAVPAAPATAPASGGKKVLDQETARKFYEQAGKDKAKARELARAAGYEF